MASVDVDSFHMFSWMLIWGTVPNFETQIEHGISVGLWFDSHGRSVSVMSSFSCHIGISPKGQFTSRIPIGILMIHQWIFFLGSLSLETFQRHHWPLSLETFQRHHGWLI
jgi:hypothetical protein